MDLIIKYIPSLAELTKIVIGSTTNISLNQ